MKKLLFILPFFLFAILACEKDEPNNTDDNDTKLSTPSLLTPQNNETITGTTFSANFTWSAINNATDYDIDMANNNTFQNATTLASSTNSFTIDSSTAVPIGTYYWRVRAKATGFETSDYSQVFSFTFDLDTNSSGSVPNLLTPADNSTVNTTRPTFTWTNVPLQGTSLYRIQFASDFTFNIVFYNGQSLTNSFTIPQSIDPLSPYSTVFWRVSADGGNTYSDYFTLNIQ